MHIRIYSASYIHNDRPNTMCVYIYNIQQVNADHVYIYIYIYDYIIIIKLLLLLLYYILL